MADGGNDHLPGRDALSGLFEALCQSSPDAIVVVRRDGGIVFANQRCEDLVGYAPSELMGRSVETLVPEQFTAHAQMRGEYSEAPVVRAMGTRPVMTARHKSGASVPVDISLSPLRRGPGMEDGLLQAVMRDATPRSRIQKNLQLQSVAMDSAANGIVITDKKGVIEWVNPAASRMTGYSAAELVGQHTRMLKSGDHDPSLYRDLWQTITANKTWYGSLTNRRKDGSVYHEEQHISPVHDEDGTLSHFIAIKQDVTARKLAERYLREAHAELEQKLAEIGALHERLQEAAVRDPLTKLYNRRFLKETVRREVARARREDTKLCAVAIDVDHFKPVNDSRGHAAGDAVLVLLADVLRETTREGDVACRIGGDEFLVLMPGAPLGAAESKSQEWRRLFLQRQRGATDSEPCCTLSIGVACLGQAGTEGRLLQQADRALYAAKQRGRDRVIRHDEM